MPALDTWFFDVPGVKLYSVEWGRSWHGHHFGGAPPHDGIAPRVLERPAHLFFSFNLDDQRLGIRIPGVRWLPLYFPLRQGQFAYRVISDSTIEICPQRIEFGLEGKRWHLENRPPPFAPRSVKLHQRPFDPGDPMQAMLWGDVYGVHILSAAQKERLTREVPKEYRRIHGRVLRGDDGKPLRSFDPGLLGLFSAFLQGHPHSRCPNRRCANRRVNGRMNLFLHLRFDEEQPGTDVENLLYEELGGGNLGELIFEFCPRCCAIRVSHQGD